MAAVLKSPALTPDFFAAQPALREVNTGYAKAWRNYLGEARAQLQSRYALKADPVRQVRAIAALTDSVIRNLADDIGLPRDHAIAATGGYGRGMLFPSSDVDLLILLPEGAGVNASSAVERFVSLLWDVGLEPGIAVRTAAECLEEAAQDITVDTSLLEARAIWGDNALLAAMNTELRHVRKLKPYFDAKIDEQRKRHGRLNDVALNLEPNIKESPGGLRDLQMVLWLSKAADLGNDWKALAREHIITATEARLIARHERVLMDLRIRLHYLSGRREDRLVFDYQTVLAQQLKLSGSRNKLPSEELMHRYYLTAKAIWQMNSILLVNLSERIERRRNAMVKSIDHEFELLNGNISARDVTIFERDPRAIFRAFLALQRVKEAEFFAPETLRSLWRAAPLIDRRFRNDPEVNRLFLEILKSEKVTFTLRRMSRYGILGRYIPAFGRIVGQMQHDLFHVYSVDEHILMVVRNLRRLVLPRFAHEFPFVHELAHEFARPEILYLAALFHDIAKGRGGDHSELGKKDARAFCKKLELAEGDAELVSWLVEMHLQMSAVAQKQDLSDPEIIAQFAARVGTERKLTALYVFTVADIRGTSPHVWNAWKAKLLEDLFRAARRLLRGDAVVNEHWVEARKAEALKLYREKKRDAEIVPALWAHVDDRYFQRFDPQEIAWHADVLEINPVAMKSVVRVRASADLGADSGFAVLVMTRDQPGLFARITGYFERLAFDIAAAKVYTAQHGFALDSFQVLPKRGKTASYRDLAATIESELARELDTQAPIATPSAGRMSRQVRHFPIAPVVTLSPSRRKPYFELSISCADRPGLLSTIARALLKYDLDLLDARVNTLGQRAEDTFVVENPQLADAAFARDLQAKIQAEIEPAR